MGCGRPCFRAAAVGPGTLVVDMTQTQFCDSSGLHALAAAHKSARAEGREVLLVVPAAAVLRVFAITGMDQVIPASPAWTRPWQRRPPPRAARLAAEGKGDDVPGSSRPGLTSAGELPGTLKRSPAGAQETFTRALAGAVQACGDGDQADRAAYAGFKRTFEKRGGRWIPKQARLRFTRAQ
jgi:hypothetical protein